MSLGGVVETSQCGLKGEGQDGRPSQVNPLVEGV